MAFEQEKKTYDQHRAKWLKKGLAGQFVVIKGTEVSKTFATFEEAYAHGAHAFKDAFLVQQISDTDEVQIIQRCYWPLPS